MTATTSNSKGSVERLVKIISAYKGIKVCCACFRSTLFRSSAVELRSRPCFRRVHTSFTGRNAYRYTGTRLHNAQCRTQRPTSASNVRQAFGTVPRVVLTRYLCQIQKQRPTNSWYCARVSRARIFCHTQVWFGDGPSDGPWILVEWTRSSR